MRMSDLTVWVVDDDASIRWVLEQAMAAAGINTRSFTGGAKMLDALDEARPDVLISDIRMPGISGLELLERVAARAPSLPTIIITAHSDLDSAVSSYRGGAFEYLPKPFDTDEAVALVRRAARSATSPATGQGPAATPRAATLIGEAPAMQDIFRTIGRLSSTDITTLITGESGTGKELVARALHENSPRANAAFIAVNTAAIPAELMESEFFGHEKGAFTGAHAQRRGRFEQAHNATLFLDEIGDMPGGLQTRLLRVLQDGTFYRVGGHQPISVDTRVIAATNRDIDRAVAEGRFRDDLYQRLNVIRLRLPALRERRADVGALLDLFLTRVADELGMAAKTLSPVARRALERADWPGNVRQLENACRWLTVMAPGGQITPDDLPAELQLDRSIGDASTQPEKPDEFAVAAVTPAGDTSPAADRITGHTNTADWQAALARWAEQRLAEGADRLLEDALPAIERILIEAALAQSGGHRQKAAQLLGWGRNTLTRKIRELERHP